MRRLLQCSLFAVLLAWANVAVAQTGPFASGSEAFDGDQSDYDHPPEISPNAERWRYSFHNGHWWYVTPERRWLYWSQGRWVEYLPPGRSNTPPDVQPPVPQRPVRRRWFGANRNAYRGGWATGPYSGGPGYFGQPGLGAY